MKKLLITLVLVGCGTQETEQSLEQKAKAAGAENTSEVISFYVANKKELPACSDKIQRLLAYVEETEEFYTCTEEAWKAVSIKGKDGKDGDKGSQGKDGQNGKDGLAGKDGLDGKDGVDGIDGVAGRDGIDGQNGQNGTNGTNGTNGADGQDGDDGISPYVPKLYSSAGLELGRVVSVNTSTNYYWIIKEDGTRYEIDRANGTLVAAAFFYKNANCTGERRTSRTNGMWANVTIETQTSKIYKQVGTYQNGWAYASKSQGGSCTNTSNTINRAYAVEEVTPQGYPWGEVEMGD